MHHNMDLRGTYAITYLVGEWRGKIELPKEAQPEPILSRDSGFMKNAKDTMEAMCFKGATVPPKRSSSESVECSAEQVQKILATISRCLVRRVMHPMCQVRGRMPRSRLCINR